MSSGRSVHSANIAEIHEMPMSEIIRPIPSVLDDKKVDSIVETLKVKNSFLKHILRLPKKLVQTQNRFNFRPTTKKFHQLTFSGSKAPKVEITFTHSAVVIVMQHTRRWESLKLEWNSYNQVSTIFKFISAQVARKAWNKKILKFLLNFKLFTFYFSLINLIKSLGSFTHLLVRTSSFMFADTITSSSILSPSPRNSSGTSCRSLPI